ncbi:MAG: hypothetical protein V4719_03455 [Planctomycetota bacterium]
MFHFSRQRLSISALAIRIAGTYSFMAMVSMTLCGCSESQPVGPERSPVSGTITFAGKPVPFGTVSFIPPEGSGLPVSGAEIQDGQYDCSKNGGVPVGKHRVEINGWSTPPTDQGAADLTAPTQAPLIPKKYNTQSELTLSVDSSNPLVKDFDLK